MLRIIIEFSELSTSKTSPTESPRAVWICPHRDIGEIIQLSAKDEKSWTEQDKVRLDHRPSKSGETRLINSGSSPSTFTTKALTFCRLTCLENHSVVYKSEL